MGLGMKMREVRAGGQAGEEDVPVEIKDDELLALDGRE